MKYRKLGNTGLNVSEIGLGGEWLERHNAAEVKEVIDHCAQAGINILDCWMSEPNVRSNIGAAIEGQRAVVFCEGLSFRCGADPCSMPALRPDTPCCRKRHGRL